MQQERRLQDRDRSLAESHAERIDGTTRLSRFSKEPSLCLRRSVAVPASTRSDAARDTGRTRVAAARRQARLGSAASSGPDRERQVTTAGGDEQTMSRWFALRHARRHCLVRLRASARRETLLLPTTAALLRARAEDVHATSSASSISTLAALTGCRRAWIGPCLTCPRCCEPAERGREPGV